MKNTGEKNSASTGTHKYDLETVEALAQVICGMCSESKPRWMDEQYKDFCHQAETHDMEATECEADAILQAALNLGIPVSLIHEPFTEGRGAAKVASEPVLAGDLITRDDACKAICQFCRDPKRKYMAAPNGEFMHRVVYGDEIFWDKCEAEALRVVPAAPKPPAP